ncbi:MAG: PQQ-binding-like beta-propeller repeat protein [Phycisphaerae bacterium]|jgi:outer membrane protein assembly factor BamB|nr:PQQ-binding-like beta-propeller repeat protein [Phycisphaerae bacterium]
MKTHIIVAFAVVLGLLSAAWAQDADQILSETGVKGGLIVHFGCGDGKLTAALRAGESYIVHGLDADAKSVSAARKHIRKLGLYGKVSAELHSGAKLPYIDNLVNLLVAGDLGEVTNEEVMRVLAPNGVAYVRSGGKWSKTVKPRPDALDDWTHYLHDASNHAVSQDTVVGPLRHFQWVAGPRYGRQHDHMSIASAMVTAGGRHFAIFDFASPMSPQLASDRRLVARDAFNGAFLWQRSIATWHAQMFRLKSGPVQLPRRLVAAGDRVYVTLGLYAPVTCLDAATGKTLATYKGTEKTEELIYCQGTLLLLINDTPRPLAARPKDLNYTFPEGPRRVVAVNAKTGDQLWSKKLPNALPSTLTADAKRVLICDGQRIQCFGRTDGKEIWRSEKLPRRKVIPSFYGPNVLIYDDVVLYSGGSVQAGEKNRGGGKDTMYALSADSGRTLWKGDHPESGYKSPEDIFVINGLVWTTENTHSGHSGVWTGRELKTGKVRKQFPPDVETHWFHHRCHRGKATVKYFLSSRTGIEFVDPKTEHWECHHWVRGACLYGIMPANGMIYNPPHPCACYLEAKMYGFNALAPTSPTRKVPRNVPAKGRLEKGPAYGKVFTPRTSDEELVLEWPTYRCDPARSGYTPAPVAEKLERTWKTKLGGKLSPVVIAAGRLFVASVDEHTVHALDSGNGKKLWSYTTGGRVDSPPTIFDGAVLFGSRDGYIYSLRASDGQLAWRFRAAPVDRRMGAFDQIESAWPVSGSVLIRDGVLWCVAGRSMFLDGGLRLIRLAPKTGKLVAEDILDDRDPESGKNIQVRLKGLNMPVALPDVLSFDGKFVYMRSQQFDDKGVRQEIDNPTIQAGARGQGPHLFSPTGFLDGVWWHRSYWIFGRVWKSGAGGYSQAGRVDPAGKPMVFNDTAIYGYGRLPQYYRWTTPLDYHLFSCDKIPQRKTLARPKARPKSGKAPGRGKNKNAKPKKRRGTLGAVPRTRLAMHWARSTDVGVRAMVLADKTLFIAGPPDLIDETKTLAAFDQPGTQKLLARQAAALKGSEGATLRVVSTADGKKISELKLDSVPVFDGMSAADGRLYMATIDGHIICLDSDE